MNSPENSEIRSPGTTRRQFLRKSAFTLLGAGIALSGLEFVHENPQFWTPSNRTILVGLGLVGTAHAAPQVWTSEQWWPIWPGKRNDRGTLLHTLDEVGGPLHVYDVTYNAHSREWQEDLAKQVRAEHPTDKWRGYCGALAIAGMALPKPIGSSNFDQLTKEGIAVASVAHYTLVDIGIAAMITKINNGEPVFIELSEIFGEEWYRDGYEISGNQVRATNYGFRERLLPINKIRLAALPYDPDTTDLSQIDPSKIYLNTHLRNPELDKYKVAELQAA